MGVFDYKNLGTEASKTLFADATAITLYTYHNLDNGFAVGYQQRGLGLGLPATLVGALLGSTDSQGVIMRTPLSAAEFATSVAPLYLLELSFDSGALRPSGVFKKFILEAEDTVIVASAGKLNLVGIGFRGTSGPRDTLIDSLVDLVSVDLLAALGPKDYAKNYAGEAFGGLLKTVADYAGAHGLSGKDVLVSGHSLGGLAVNSMADLSTSKWAGFYKDTLYAAALWKQQAKGDTSLPGGYTLGSDPFLTQLDAEAFLPQEQKDALVHDKAHESTTDNIVSFNDHYASTLWNVLPFSIANLSTWVSHLPSAYGDGMTRVLESGFYEQMTRDSTIILCPTWSDPARANTWVQDLNRNAEPHTGNTFIIGSDGNDLIQGGKGADFIEGGKGNDTIRDNSGSQDTSEY
nr:lipase [uncultured bacterium]